MEAPLDAMALSLFRLTQYNLAEIQRGHCGQGEYHLRDGLQPITSDVVPTVVIHPNFIVERIRGSTATSNEQSAPSAPSGTVSGQPTSPVSPAEVEPDGELENNCPTTTATTVLSAAERAAGIIQSQQIALDVKLAVFTVMGTNEPRVVRLFPKPTCSCPAKANCYYVLAARMAVGITGETQKRRVMSLTQLQKNVRKRPDKTSGRKRPRLDDIDVVPAGDVDEHQAAALHDAIVQVTDTHNATPVVPTTADIGPDTCHVCNAENPPAGKSKRRKVINWVCCDDCDRWFHMVCVHLQTVPLYL